MKKITLFLLCLLFAGAGVLQAQSLRITGVVTDAGDGQLLPGVSVHVKNSSIVTVTDIDGRYSITAPNGAAVLVFSYIGYKTVETVVGTRTVINVQLEVDALALEEVVVTGYGSVRRQGSTIGSVVQVSGAKIEAKPAANVMDAIQGQVPGLAVYSTGGDPAQTQSVSLHGVGSLGTSSTPLYIVDGIVVESGSVVAMNPNDFESVSVLKDASSTSIYGSRAANGVVYITTKRGTRGSDAKISFRTQYGISKLAEKSFYDMMSTDELLDFWLKSRIRTQAQVDAIKANPAALDARGNLHNTKWIDVYMRDNTPTYQSDLSIQGGGGKTAYFVSGGQYHQEGTARNNFYDRFTLRSNIESQAKDWLKVGVNLMLSTDKRGVNDNFGSGGVNNSTGGGLNFLQQPYWSPVDNQGNRYDLMAGSNAAHPAYYAEMNKRVMTNYQLIGNFFFEITPFKGFKIISRTGTDARMLRDDQKRDPRYKVGANLNNGRRYISDETFNTTTTNNVMEYSFSINNEHNFTVLGGQEGQLYNYTSLEGYGEGITDFRLMRLSDIPPANRVATSGGESWAFLSYFGRADYNYEERFFVDFSLRNDASSRFGREHRNAMFWSVGAMWNLKKEGFLKDLSAINAARFKVSYGTQGNAEIGNYRHLATTSTTTNYNGAPSWYINNPGNSGLTWETQSKLTVGLRAEFLNKYSIEVEGYQRKTSNMLFSVPFPYTSGFSSLYSNVGTLQNTGIDLNLNMNFVRTKDANVSAYVVFNYNKDKVTELFYGFERWQVANTYVAYVVGEPVKYYAALYKGVDPETGRPVWYLPGENKDKIQKDPSKVSSSYDSNTLDQTTDKPRYAPIKGGFGLNASWKGIQLSADFVYALGKWMIDNTTYFSQNPNVYAGYNQSRQVMDFWTEDNRNAKYPDWRIPGMQMQFDSSILSDASFMRLKNLTLAYNVDKKLLGKTKILSNLRVYCTGRNLFTWTKYIGMDPENNTNLVYGNYQNSKQYQFGIEIGF